MEKCINGGYRKYLALQRLQQLNLVSCAKDKEEPGGARIFDLPAPGSSYVFWLKLSAISPRATVQESLRFNANDKVGFAWKPGQNIQNSAIFNEASENVREEKEHESEDMRT